MMSSNSRLSSTSSLVPIEVTELMADPEGDL